MNQASHCRSLICYISSFNSYKQHEWGSRVVIVTLFKQVSFLLLRLWTNLCNIMFTNYSEQQWTAFKSDDNPMYFIQVFWFAEHPLNQAKLLLTNQQNRWNGDGLIMIVILLNKLLPQLEFVGMIRPICFSFPSRNHHEPSIRINW